jgi:hypothetical protein
MIPWHITQHSIGITFVILLINPNTLFGIIYVILVMNPSVWFGILTMIYKYWMRCNKLTTFLRCSDYYCNI